MAVFCLARDLNDLIERLGRIVVGQDSQGAHVTCADLKAQGAMAALLRDAFQPNLVQTLEGSPALVHGGPFANIAHGCNSLIATRTALRLADLVVTEAGFGADLGAEKFFDIKCRQADLAPAAAVIVATIRSLKMNGGLARGDLGHEDLEALQRGCANLGRHIENVRRFGVPVIVAINHFVADTSAEIAAVQAYAASHGVEAILCRHWAQGAVGAETLARRVAEIVDEGAARFAPLYPDDMRLIGKIETVAREIYRAGSVSFGPGVARQLARWDRRYGRFAVCIAKTQYSFSTDPERLGAASGHDLHVREVRLAAGAGFVVAVCGDIMTMPGLPRHPAAERIGLDAQGQIVGLF
jgi:formate--tetrahydrofolate ligase